MKKILITAAIAALSLAAAAEVKVEWLETEQNFGAFDENDGNVTCHFRFVNTGDEPINVFTVRTSCGCTTSQPPREAIQPGDTASVSATYNPIGRPGRFEKKIYVDMNTNPRRFTLKIHGTVIGSSNTLRSRYPVDAGDVKLRTVVIPFGEVMKGKVKNEFFEFYNVSKDTIRPTWENLPPYVRAASAVNAVAPGEQSTFAMIFDSTSDKIPYGIVTDSIYFRAHPGAEPVKVDVIANVVEDFSRLTPQQRKDAPVVGYESRTVDFGDFDASGTVSREFTISNRGKNQLIVRRVYSGDPGISAKIDKTKIKSGKSATITVTVDPAALPAEMLNGRISIITNDPANPLLIIRAVGFPKE